MYLLYLIVNFANGVFRNSFEKIHYLCRENKNDFFAQKLNKIFLYDRKNDRNTSDINFSSCPQLVRKSKKTVTVRIFTMRLLRNFSKFVKM